LIRLIFILFLILFVITGCSRKEASPLPVGYNRIERITSEYKYGYFTHFRFLYSDVARLDNAYNEANGQIWFNIIYPQYNARIYCTYTPIEKNILKKILEDNHRLAYSHAVQADGIRQTLYSNPSYKTYGILYDIDGNVATPVQFFLTDSVSNFFRASLYYDTKVKVDSVSPVTGFIREDIVKMIETFEWR